jgi:hypothetical protein
MKKIQKKNTGHNKGVLSKLNDKTDQDEKKVATNKKKGIISKLNDKSDQKK